MNGNGENGRPKTENGIGEAALRPAPQDPSCAPEQEAEQVRDFKQLLTWQVAMDIVDDVYDLTETFPPKQYALTNQMQRAAVSVPSNIAEGYGKNTKREYIQCVKIARGSLAELETQLLIAARRGYIAPDHEVFQRVRRCYRLMYGLIRSLER